MSELSDIQMFVTVVHEGSFSAAARATGLTPSAVSRQIAALEEELDARLFQRTTRKQSLTEAGVTYLRYAELIITTLSEGRLAVNQLTERVSGSLLITVEQDMAQTFISPHLPEFFALHPDLSIRLMVNPGLVNLVESGVDLAIRVGHLKDSSFLARKIGESRSVICASPHYLSRASLPSYPHDLNQHNCLSFRTGQEKRIWQFTQTGVNYEVEVNGNFKVNNLTLLKSAALAGVGIVMIPTWMIQKELSSGDLIPLLPNYVLDPPSTPINAIYSHRQHLAPKIRAFVDFLVLKMTR